MATAALLLRSRRLLAGPTCFVSTRMEPHIPRMRAAAAASSPPSPRPTHSDPFVHPRCPPSPRSTPSAASISAHHPPPSTHSIDTHRCLSLRPMHSTPAPVSHRGHLTRLKASSIGDRCHSAKQQRHLGLVGAVETDPRALYKGRKAALPSVGLRSARQVAVPMLCCRFGGQRRYFSDIYGLPQVNQSSLPPVRQLAFGDDSQVSHEEWIAPIDYLKKHPLVVDARTNSLNLEMPEFAEQPRYNFSEDVGIPLFKSLIFLALVNNNRGYSVNKSFKKDNLLLCPRLKLFMFKNVSWDNLDTMSKVTNRASSYSSAANLMQELLMDTIGSDVVSQLLEEPRDLFSKMELPSDERLIIYHPSLLLMDGRIWLYEKLYRFFFKIVPLSNDEKLKSDAFQALCEMAYTSGKKDVLDIIKAHPLLSQIDSNQPNMTNSSTPDSAMKKSQRHAMLGRKIVALPRHTIEHAFDKDLRMVESKLSTEGSPKKLWCYSLDQVVDMLKSVIPLHLLKAQEVFLRIGLWSNLQIDNFWARDLTWMGGVPPPTEKERAAIQKAPSYGKRRLQAKKFDQLPPRNDKRF